MKKRIILLLALLFALYAVVVLLPELLRSGRPSDITEPPAENGTAEAEPETLEEKTFPYETVWTESGAEGETETEAPTNSEEGPGEPIDREKAVTDILFASDIHYMSQSLTDYGKAFTELIDNGDGKVVQYMPQIWDAFAEEVIAARPDALILSGDLTMNGERVNHQELADHLRVIQEAGIPVLVIPGNHDINNPYATSYFGEEQTFIEAVDPKGFWEIYHEFGYDAATDYAPDSMSYRYELNETTWLLMLDTCIYEPENEIGGEIRPGTVTWMEECLKEAYAEGITVIPVGHHNLQELSRVYVDDCVISNSDEIIELLERYLTPVYFGGHLHVQRIVKHIKEPGVTSEVYGVWEIVSNSLSIPPCQYGNLTLNADGSLSYHTRNVDVSGWAAKHGEENQDLLEFPAFSEEYVHTVISRRINKLFDHIPDELRDAMSDFYAELYRDYYAGRKIDYKEKRKEQGYQYWERFMSGSVPFRQVVGMLKDSAETNNNAEIPNPIGLLRE